MSQLPPPISDQPVLMLQDLWYQRGSQPVLAGVTLQVRRGEIAAISGEKGAGKTTLMQTISGQLAPSRGAVIFKGEDITGVEPSEVVAQGLSYVTLGHSIFAHLSAMDNLRMGAYTRTDPDGVAKDLEAVFRYFPALRSQANAIAGALSPLQHRLLALACAIMAGPDLILIDGLCDSLRPEDDQAVFEQLLRINRERGTAMLIAQEHANAVLAIADYGYIMGQGRIAHEGSSASLRRKLEPDMTQPPARRAHETA